jgi:hypothetical protein
MKRFLNLGAGVQSSTLALMIERGEVEPVDAAIFSDTQWERRVTYDWLDWLEKQLSYPVYRVTNGNLRANVLESKNTTGGRFATVPWFIKNPDGTDGMGRRQCTSEYKLIPLTKKKRELLGLAKGQRAKRGTVLCETFIGISTDEVWRVHSSDEPWNVHRWPLLEKRMSRSDCNAWMLRHGYPLPPKSACEGCPFHDDDQWLEIHADQEAWARVLELDKAIREPVRGQRGQQFMNDQRIPMDEFIAMVKEGRHVQRDLFNNECLGMCGN